MLFLFFLEWWKKKNDLPSVQSICKVWDFDPVTIDVTYTTQEEKEKAELLLWYFCGGWTSIWDWWLGQPHGV
jgi:hypothetical protein